MSADDLRALLGASGERGDELLLAILQSIEALEEASDAHAHTALNAAYAAWVEYASVMYERGDVDGATFIATEIAADAEESGHFVLAARALIHAGFLAMREAKIDESDRLHRRAEALARRARSIAMVYRARIGRANLVRMRGNLPAAEAMLDRVVRGARRHAPSVVARALLMRSNVAWARGQHAEAVVIATEALFEAPDERIRTRTLIEIASLLTEFADTALGAVSRQILEYAVVHSPQHATRQHAAIGLLSLSVDQRRPDDFAKWRAMLDGVRIAPRHAIHYAMNVARGIQAFGLPDDPLRYLNEAERIATEHGLSQYLFVIADQRDALTRAAAGGQVRAPASDTRTAPTVSNGVRAAAQRVVAQLAVGAVKESGR